MLTLREIQERIEAIAAEKGDPEEQHYQEDKLYVAVLKAIASDQLDGISPREAAERALKAADFIPVRWYA